MAQRIKRYRSVVDYRSRCSTFAEIEDGEWVKWKDVAPLLEAQSASTNMPRDEIRLLAESIVSCINGGQYDNAKVLAESIIAELSPVG